MVCYFIGCKYKASLFEQESGILDGLRFNQKYEVEAFYKQKKEITVKIRGFSKCFSWSVFEFDCPVFDLIQSMKLVDDELFIKVKK